MTASPSEAGGIRRADIMAALSIATDLTMGQPLEFALTSCVLAMRLGERLKLDDAAMSDVFAEALLRYIGCNADTDVLASLLGDEIAMRGDFARVDAGRPGEVLPLMIRYLRQANAGASPLRLAAAVIGGLGALHGSTKEMFAGHCEVAQRLAVRLGFGDSVLRALGQLYERWDGRGMPRGLKGEEISVAVRVVALAQDAVTFYRLGGVDAARRIARERRGGAYDPAMVDCFCTHAETALAGLQQTPAWDEVLQLDPAPGGFLDAAQLDQAFRAMGDFVDIKSPFTRGHSTAVAALARDAAERARMSAAEISLAERAALLHDIGQVGISSSVWERRGPLSEREREQVRLHPYYTERILARPADLASIGAIAGLHHERVDGSGYHRAAAAHGIPAVARLVAAADVYQALLEARPHRGAMAPEQAAAVVRDEARGGRLDGDAVSAVLSAAGHRTPRKRPPDQLTDREREVVRLLARGQSMKQVAMALTIAPKTVDNHVQRIYAKCGVSTRAGLAMYAMENDLLH